MGLAQSVQDAGEAVADRMKKNQQDMMTAQMERQMRAMQVQMMAVTRERTLWFGGVTSALALALLVGGLSSSGYLRLFLRLRAPTCSCARQERRDGFDTAHSAIDRHRVPVGPRARPVFV
jgi:hypothetical protein